MLKILKASLVSYAKSGTAFQLFFLSAVESAIGMLFYSIPSTTREEWLVGSFIGILWRFPNPALVMAMFCSSVCTK